MKLLELDIGLDLLSDQIWFWAKPSDQKYINNYMFNLWNSIKCLMSQPPLCAKDIINQLKWIVLYQ